MRSIRLINSERSGDRVIGLWSDRVIGSFAATWSLLLQPTRFPSGISVVVGATSEQRQQWLIECTLCEIIFCVLRAKSK